MRRAAIVLMVLMSLAAGTARAGTATLLYTDPVADGVVLGPALPPFVDLIEGAIEETPTTLIITWKLVHVPDGTNGLPGTQRLDFEFDLDDPDGIEDPEDFAIRLETTRTGGTIGWIDGSCVQGSAVTCTRLPGATVATSVDAAADVFRAEVQRSHLRSGGASVAVDGAVLTEKFMYRGIASYIGVAGALVTHNLSDQADLSAPYVLGSTA